MEGCIFTDETKKLYERYANGELSLKELGDEIFGAANGINGIVQVAQKVSVFLVHSSQYAEMAKKALHF